jgi:hypothetical protein
VLGARRPVPVSGPRDERIGLVASLQRGRINRAQLRMAGISDSSTDRLKAFGQLHLLHRGVFAVGHDAPIELGDETAALLAVCDGAALSHGTAAAIWGMARPGSDDGWIHVVVPIHSASPSGVRVHRTRILEPPDVRLRHGLPVTSPARTLLDRAETLAPRQLELEFDQTLISRIMRPAEVRELLGRAQGRPGAARLDDLLKRQTGPKLTRSEARRGSCLWCERPGFPSRR